MNIEIDAVLMCDSHHGQYVPQVFAQTVNWDLCHNYSKWAKDTLLDGPDNEFYWNAMTEIEDRLVIQSEGKEYVLVWSMGDLFAVNFDHVELFCKVYP